MPRYIRQAQLLLSTAGIALIANVPATHAGCAPVPTAGGDIIVCDAAIAPNPSGPINFLGGGDTVTVNSGAYGAFTFPSGNNTLIFGAGGGAPVIAGTVVFGAGADRMEVHSGTITGNVSQGSGIGTFIMAGGLISGSVNQGDQFDTAIISGGVIVGTLDNGDFVTITGGTIGAVDLNVANNVFTMAGGTVLGDVT